MKKIMASKKMPMKETPDPHYGGPMKAGPEQLGLKVNKLKKFTDKKRNIISKKVDEVVSYRSKYRS